MKRDLTTGNKIMRKRLLTTVAVVLFTACSHQPPSLLDQANESFGLAQFGMTITLCDQCLASEPGNLQAILLRGRAHFERGDAAKAIEDYSRVIDASPDDPEAYYFRAKAYQENGQLELAAHDKASARERDIRAQLAYTVKPREEFPNLDRQIDRFETPDSNSRKPGNVSDDPLQLDQPFEPLAYAPQSAWRREEPMAETVASGVFPITGSPRPDVATNRTRIDLAPAVPTAAPSDGADVPPVFDPNEAGVFDRWLAGQRELPGSLANENEGQSQENAAGQDADEPMTTPRTDERVWTNFPNGGAFVTPTRSTGGVARTGYPFYENQPLGSAQNTAPAFSSQLSTWPVSPQFPNQQTISSYQARQFPHSGPASGGGHASAQRPASGQPANSGSSTAPGVWQYQVPFPLPNAATTGVIPDFMD
jgi:hypothetical protein